MLRTSRTRADIKFFLISLQGVCNGHLVTICKNESNCHVPTFDIGTINARIRTMSLLSLDHWRVQVLVAVALYAILYTVIVHLQIKTTWSKNDPFLISLKEQQQQHQRLVMYVGPIKTASTTLQFIMKEHNRTLQEDDGFNVQGRLSPGEIRLPMLASMRDKHCRNKTETARLNNTNLPQCWETISNELDVSSKSILIVEENLCDLRFDLPSFIDAVFPKYSVELVLGYRRLHQWLGSAKNEYEKKYGGYPPPNSIATVAEYPYFVDRDRHPSNVGFFETFANATIRRHYVRGEGRTDFTCNTQNKKPCSLKYIDSIIEAYQPLLDAGARLRFVNIHDKERGAPEQFYCDVLNATATCAAIMAKNGTKSSNPSKSLDYDRIAVEAFDRGLFKPIENIREYRTKIGGRLWRYHAEKLNYKPLPLECESDSVLEALLQESIRLERELVPHLFNETDLRLDFEMTKSKGKFCSVNATAVLEDPEWRKVFADGQWLEGLAIINN